MTIRRVNMQDVQFSDPKDEKLRQFQTEVKKLQTALNSVIERIGGDALLGNDSNARIIGASPHLAAPASDLLPGQWELTLVDTGAQVFRVRYNDGGTIRTGDLTLT